MTAKPIAPSFQQMMTPLQQMQQGFQNTMQQIQNDPFPLIEQFLGQRAMSQVDQAMQPMQQEAIQKVSGVMSGIRSLVNEAFPNMGGGMSGGGMSTTGQLGQGIASLGGTAIPAAPFTTPAEIPATPMQPPMMGDLSQITTPQIMGDPPAIPQPMQGGESIGDKLFGTKMTDIVANQKASMGQPQQLSFEDDIAKDKYFGDKLFGTKIADIGPVSATIDPTVDMMKYNPAINYNVYKPAMDESGGLDPSDPASPAYNPAMEYNPVFPMPIQKQVEDPLINLAYNFNMENSPF